MARRIADLPLGERPRERMLERGEAALSEAELIALVLRTGDAASKASVLDLAHRLLAVFGGSRHLARATVGEIAKIPGLGPAKAASILAAVELGRRIASRPIENGSVFRASADVYAHFRGRLSALRREVFCILLLDAKHRKLREVQVSEGSLTASIVHPREVFAPAVRDSAAAMILVHNHPSGDPAPSPEDVEITRRLREVGEILGVRVLDHVIVGAATHFSFADSGYF
jgi:DNA repair protein RadC